MSINFDTGFSFNTVEVKRFLISDTEDIYVSKPEDISGFSHDNNNRRPSLDALGQQAIQEESVVFLQQEVYQLFERGTKQNSGRYDGGTTVGLHQVYVALEHQLRIYSDFYLYLQDALSDEASQYASHIFHDYDPAVHGDDVIDYMKANLNGRLNENDFEIETAVTIQKVSSKPNEADISQRLKLFDLLDCNDPPASNDGQIDIDNMDMGLPQWSRERKSYLKLVSVDIVADDANPPSDPNYSATVSDPDNNSVVANAIDLVLRDVIPSSCGGMARKEIKLLTIAEWPEFRIVWKKKRIKIGCSRITVTYPVLQIRMSKLVFYAYFKLPRNAGRFVVSIATVCAKRSALTSAVIGIVTSNIGAAIASFTPLFKRCIETEVKNCLYPGLFLAKKAGHWH